MSKGNIQSYVIVYYKAKGRNSLSHLDVYNVNFIFTICHVHYVYPLLRSLPMLMMYLKCLRVTEIVCMLNYHY